MSPPPGAPQQLCAVSVGPRGVSTGRHALTLAPADAHSPSPPGSGEPAATLAAALPDARVLSTDLAPPYLELGRAHAAREGLSNLSFETADAEDLHRYPDASFDAVCCSLGLMCDGALQGVVVVVDKRQTACDDLRTALLRCCAELCRACWPPRPCAIYAARPNRLPHVPDRGRFMPNAGGALAEMARVLKPGGHFAATVWGVEERVPFFHLTRQLVLGA